MALRSGFLSPEATSPGAEGLSKAKGRKVPVKEAQEAFIDAFEEARRKVKSEDIREASRKRSQASSSRNSRRQAS